MEHTHCGQECSRKTCCPQLSSPLSAPQMSLCQMLAEENPDRYQLSASVQCSSMELKHLSASRSAFVEQTPNGVVQGCLLNA